MNDGQDDDDIIPVRTSGDDDSDANTNNPPAVDPIPDMDLDDDTVVAADDDLMKELEDGTTETPNNGDIQYPQDKIEFRGENNEHIVKVIEQLQRKIGPKALDEQSRQVGSWANLMIRSIMEPNFEEIRIREALNALSAEDRQGMSNRLRDDAGKTLLRTGKITQNITAGSTKTYSDEEALMAFECQKTIANPISSGGGYRIPLVNSGITIDVITPTGIDIETLMQNCVTADKQLGSTNGAQYFTYDDTIHKINLINFIQSLITNSSYANWRKKDKLWSVIKLPDLVGLVATLAAMMYRDGFDGFISRCSRPADETFPNGCQHTEEITANIFEMVTTRWSVLSKESIDFLVAARGNVTHNNSQIASYQSKLGLEGERITFDNVTFVMRIPSVAEYLESGRNFLSDVINEIEGDNTEGRLEALGLRYIRTFLPWIASVEQKGVNDDVMITSGPKTITRTLEKLDDAYREGEVRNRLRHYIDKVQMTYVGYPATECPACGYTANTPSGLVTFDPFNAFFTLAFLYLNQTA